MYSVSCWPACPASTLDPAGQAIYLLPAKLCQVGIKVFLPAIHMVPLLAGHVVVTLSMTHQVYRLSHPPVSERLFLEHAEPALLQ